MKEEYNKLKKKYDLPDFSELNENFNLEEIEQEKFLLKSISRRMCEKIGVFSNLMEEELHPEGKLSTLHESSQLEDEDKKTILKIYRQLIFREREFLSLEINYEEEKYALFVKELFIEWNSLKPPIKDLLEKIKTFWSHDKKIKLELSYFG